jgi:hypothetical protein
VVLSRKVALVCVSWSCLQDNEKDMLAVAGSFQEHPTATRDACLQTLLFTPTMRHTVWAAAIVVLLALAVSCSADSELSNANTAVEERVQSLEAEVSELRELAKSLLAVRAAKSGSNLEVEEASGSRARRLQTANRTTPAVVFKVGGLN